jgi:hypothetical protein
LSILLIGLSALTILSCSEESLTGAQEMQSPSTTGNAITTAQMQAQAKQMVQSPSPQEISQAFFAMVDKAAAMSAADIDSLSEEEILELGKPILLAFGNTVQFDKETLSKLDDVIGTVISDPTAITKAQRDQTASKIETILSRSSSSFSRRSYGAQEIRLQLKRIEGTRGLGDLFDCSDYFNQQGDTVYLYPNDNFGLANFICPSGSTFFIFPGTYQGQIVENSRNENTWIGFAATLDGMNATKVAFKDGMDNNYMDGITIKNYTRHGILSDGSENVSLMNLTFENIAPYYCKTSVCGQNEGAIMFTNSENIQVRFSNFTNVASGIRFKHSTGPLVASHNEALNPGRNFFQCDECTGGNIEIIRNSMDLTATYGNKKLEDWINIFKSDGVQNDPIRVNNNRARTNAVASSLSPSGSFIILGDWGGTYQEAKNNVGVNPGQVGIGASGGTHVKIENNKMYSQLINGISNVAFYSNPIPSHITCASHSYNNNQANWIFGGDPQNYLYGKQNKSWTNPDNEPAIITCGITHQEITDDSNVLINLNMGAEIWEIW